MRPLAKIVLGTLVAGVLVAAGFGWGYSYGSPGYRLSPTDKTRLDTAAGRIEITYARPYARQRKIFGDVVPYDRVWRTGANEATVLRTDTDLVFEDGRVRVPEGEYSLYSLPGRGSFTLIVNQETGQWGTEYDESRDLARVAMDVVSGDVVEHVEQFTLALEPTAAGGRLVLAWESTRATAAFVLPEMPAAPSGDEPDGEGHAP